MDVLEAIRTRRSIYDWKPGQLPTTTIERLLEYGTWAPNHRLTQPWRFSIIGPETKATLAAALSAHTLAKADNPDHAARLTARDKAVAKFLAKPNIVAVSCLCSADPERQQEDLAAVAAALQNIQLAAWAEGLGVQISTGAVIKLPHTPAILGIDPDHEIIVAFLFLGVPAAIPKAGRRRPLHEVTRSLP